jgi:formate/nitrite transporter
MYDKFAASREGMQMEKSFLAPIEIAEAVMDNTIKKTKLPLFKMILLGILGGAFIAFGAQGSNVAIHTIGSAGIAKALGGTIFSAGLMLVVLAGAELFTGNCLLVMPCYEGKTKWIALFKNWAIIYLSNFAGALLVVFLILHAGQYAFSDGLLGGFTIKTAAYKTGLTFEHAFFMGILCNWLVCLAIWLATAAKDIAGKILGIFFPIWLFIASGFEHSVANMYYISAGIFAKANPAWVDAAISLGATKASIDGLGWQSFLLGNLLPVTLGNIVGGALFVGTFYWLVYQCRTKSAQPSRLAEKTDRMTIS